MIRSELLSPSSEALGLPPISHSLRVRASDFRADWLSLASAQLHLPLTPPHRKLWEFAVILHVFRVLKASSPTLIRPRVLGFGVGREPLPAWFVGHGCSVLATDKPEADTLAGWKETGQHAAGHSQLGRLGYVSEEEFAAGCEYRAIDMADLPSDLWRGRFDLTYSCGSFEHIGGAHAGLLFFTRQMDVLRPGGIAVHTTEYEYDPDPGTLPLDTPDLSLYRDADIAMLSTALEAQGDLLLPLDAARGIEPEDLYIDHPPYEPSAISHLNIELAGGRRTTSIALIAIRGRR